MKHSTYKHKLIVYCTVCCVLLQAAAERARRERVLTAEGEKRSAQLKSEGVKLQLINESEGHLIKVQNEAKANKDRLGTH
jgi:hypothetical protein